MDIIPGALASALNLMATLSVMEQYVPIVNC